MLSNIVKSKFQYIRILNKHCKNCKNRRSARIKHFSIKVNKEENISQFLDGQNIFENENLLRQMMIQATSTKRDSGDFVPSKITSYLIEQFDSLNDDDKLKFFTILINELGVENSEIEKLTNDLTKLLREKRDEASIILAESKLRTSLIPSYEKLFIQINAQRGGMKKLIDMRESLLKILRKIDRTSKDYPKLKYLEKNLKGLLQHWFSIGFLNLERITWNHPGAILEKIFHYSTSVHPMKDWEELKRRLQNNKRCYAYFHPSIPTEPVIFIEVELTNEISSSIEPITQRVSTTNIENPTTAIFYAITSTQAGLSGIDLGNMLIKRVVKELKDELPSLNTFCTLSPIPSFRIWLETRINLAENEKTKESHQFDLLTSSEIEFLRSRFPNETEPAKLFKLALNTDWINDNQMCNFLKGPLMRICAKYIYSEKKNNLTLDPVANFHLRNGAQFYRINWLADKSEHRIKQSYGIMANYLYIIDEVNMNNENYLMKGEVKSSNLILDLIK